jgi:adenine-specific DNA-methyltransferase
MQQEAKQKIQELVEKYEKVRASHSVSKYTEEDTKTDFIQPLFQALGWNMSDRNEVSKEEVQSGGRIDYGFYLDGRLKFNVEAKSLRTDLNREGFANQAVKYSWNKGATWAILTDFESLKVFNAQIIDRQLADKLYFDIPYSDYLKRFDQLWLLSKEAFQANLLDQEAGKVGKMLQKVSVSALLYKDLNECRDILTHVLSMCNPKVNKDLLDEGVQKLLDRLIFLRVAEDRGIEGPILKELLREHEEKGGHKFQSMVKKFRELDEIYNSNLFSEHPFEKWEEYGDATEKVIKILYGKPGYYEYDFKAMPADVLGGVYENYLGYRLEKSRKGLSVSKDAKKRKESGIYYTPDFIVDYIVKNTLKPVLDKCTSIEQLKKIKVLDPACGSGSFLIKALEVIHAKYIEFGNRGDIWTKIDILLNNIYGVDLDSQAVEIARLNLLINALDTKMKLPGLENNIKQGNSLVSDRKINPDAFDWKEEFPKIFDQGGFDVVIGNPPYGADINPIEKEYYKENFVYKNGKPETYLYFIEKSIELLKKNGLSGFIVPNAWLTNYYGIQIRKFILENYSFRQIVDLEPAKVFRAVVDTIVYAIQKQKIDDNKVQIYRANKNYNIELLFTANQNDWLADDELIINLNSNNDAQDILKKIESSAKNLGSLAEYSQGIIPYKTKEDGVKNLYISDKKVGEEWKPLLESASQVKRFFIDKTTRYIKYGPWLWCSREQKYFVNPKLLFHRLRKKLPVQLVGAIDDTGLINRHSLSNLILKSQVPKEDLYAILGLFNSKLANWWFVNRYGKLMEIGGFKVAKIPLFQNWELQKHNLIGLVKLSISLNKQVRKYIENSEKWKSIKSEIEKTDQKINDEVYKLYDLSDSEIKTIETA